MNNERRKRIQEQIDALTNLQSDVQSILDEEQEAFDNLPESFQESDKGSDMQEKIDYLESAVSNIEDILNDLESAKE